MARLVALLSSVFLASLLLWGTCSVAQCGTIAPWGWNWEGQCDVPAPNSDFDAIAGGGRFSVGLKHDGTVILWGNIYNGQINVPAPNQDFTAIAAGHDYTAGLKNNGSVVCWGNNTFGQRSVPAPNQDFTAISSGANHTVGLKNNNSIVCWGNNASGQLDVPAPNADFIAVAGGEQHSAGLRRDGSVICWGDTANGRCNVPAPNADFIAIAAGGGVTAGLKRDGSVICWGNNSYGQLNVPAPNQDFIAIAVGERHTIGLKRDGSVVCWGNNNYGQCNIAAPNSGFIAIASSSTSLSSLALRGTFAAPTITSFTPTSGNAGQTVTITGTNFTGAYEVLFNGMAANFNVATAISISATVPNGASTGKITVTTPGGTATSAANFTTFLPKITSFSPAFGKAGDIITITGTYFTGTSVVKFNGTLVTELTVNNAASISATVPVDATTGTISVTTAGGTATSAAVLYIAPAITAFEPASGKVGDIITITGLNFTGASSVEFGGISSTSFTVVNNTSITATIPNGATTGKIAITTPGGTASSDTDFTVYEPSTLEVTINPGAGYIGALGDITLNYSLNGPKLYTGPLTFSIGGKATVLGLQPGIYDLSLTGRHWLRRIISSIDLTTSNSVNTTLSNGDSDGDGQVNLFDFVVLDMRFGSADTMADLDGDGNVNLFDYTIIDQYFGAQSDL